ncbi:class I poly(R)-hydroxyalkanoic acid synthase [Sandarakinorhabdus sp. AAP62]|uniref:PHA/PHB synthase family protein n=1 Tax=Sandarakinorhabdus sp. AAP62 TaxID=1248916 RepID=UPI0002E6A332|nr:class I poly(R)-hydroxyalkanoic acid synthase [Sandarakinorhabdus sp. AAP62]
MPVTPDTSDTKDLGFSQAQAQENFRKVTDLMGKGQQMMMEFWTREHTAPPMVTDPMGFMSTWQKAWTAMLSDPAKLLEMQQKYMTDAMALWQSFLSPDAEKPAIRDKRFANAAWAESPAFDFLRQSYLLTASHFMEAAHSLDGLEPAEKAKAQFIIKQFVDAMSPSNFALTNPEVLKATAETGGANLLKGLEHLLGDLQTGRMKMTDENAFEVGRNVAITPGKVVFQNRLLQLIQYTPTTQTVYEIPLVIFPPWINKFYILDLTAEKSFIRWAVEQGITVFVASWKNADASIADATVDTYVEEGIFAAVNAVREICNTPSTHAIGYCVAGTTLAAAMAVLESRGDAANIATATFFTAQVDFEEAGELKFFVDDPSVETLDKVTEDKPVLDGRFMATTFNLLRSNDLIWNYVVNNYMLGKDYFPFDLLYWNSDATNVPARWHQQYIRDMYRENLLVKPGGMNVCGVPIDLKTVKTPIYIQGGKEDHIAPARSAFKLTKAFSNEARFVLAGSGHIAGVVNPPSAKKYQHWTGDSSAANLDEFIAGATEHKGSWWPDWLAWLTPRSGPQVKPRVPGEGPYKAIEDAPGAYVKERI